MITSTSTSSSSSKKKSKTKTVRELLPDYFIDLDRNFIGLKNVQDETFVYKSSDVLVQANWELPVSRQFEFSGIVYYSLSTASFFL
jgi:hypothetical protein